MRDDPSTPTTTLLAGPPVPAWLTSKVHAKIRTTCSATMWPPAWADSSVAAAPDEAFANILIQALRVALPAYAGVVAQDDKQAQRNRMRAELRDMGLAHTIADEVSTADDQTGRAAPSSLPKRWFVLRCPFAQENPYALNPSDCRFSALGRDRFENAVEVLCRHLLDEHPDGKPARDTPPAPPRASAATPTTTTAQITRPRERPYLEADGRLRPRGHREFDPFGYHPLAEQVADQMRDDAAATATSIAATPLDRMTARALASLADHITPWRYPIPTPDACYDIPAGRVHYKRTCHCRRKEKR